MAYNVTLNSSNVIGNNNSQFQYNFIRGSLDVPVDSEIQLTSMTYPYSMQNITSSLGNNSLGYLAPTTSNNITISNGFTFTDTANSTSPTTNSTGSAVSTVTVLNVGYVNSTGTMAINITGATGFTAPLLVTSTNAQSGTCILQLNQSVNLPSVGASVTFYYVGATTVAITTSAGNYVLNGYYLFNSSTNPQNYFISSSTANVGAMILTLVQPITTTSAGLTSSYQLIVRSVGTGSNTVLTFIGSFTYNPITPQGYILSSTWAGNYTGYGSPINNYLYNISAITGSYYQASINTLIVGAVSSSITASYRSNYYPVNISNGFYTMASLNSALQSTLFTNGHYWYNSNPINIQGTIAVSSGAGVTVNLTASGIVSQIDTLPTGSGVWGNNGTTANFYFGTISGVVSANVYSVLTAAAFPAVSTAQPFAISNNNEITVGSTSAGAIYPLSLSTNTSLYTNSITSIIVPVQANIFSVFGVGFFSANGIDGTTLWSGNYPTSNGNCFQLILPTATKTTNNISNLLGFVGGLYPSSGSGQSSNIVVLNGDSLSANPPFAALGSTVNAIVVRCNLVENDITMPSDVLQTIPITTTYGSNINFLSPNSNTLCKMKAGKFNAITITLTDQNGNVLQSLDPTCLISLLIKYPKKK